MKRRVTPQPLVRALFALAVVALPIQYVIEHRSGEPYPGLYQPSFSGVPQRGDQAFTSEPVVVVTYGDGSREEFTASRLLPDNPVVPTSTLTSALVDGDGADDPRTARWLRDLVLASGPRRDDPSEAAVRVVTTAYDLDGGRSERTGAKDVRTLSLEPR